MSHNSILHIYLTSLQGNEGLFILDTLLLDIFQHTLDPSVEAVEESFIQRTGHNFDDLHDGFLQPEFGSQGIEDFIENDSRLLIVDDSVVYSKFPYYPGPRNGGKQVLDLSNRDLTSCRALIEECLQARNASHAMLRQSTISEAATLWPVGVLDFLSWFCPSVSWIDVTGCVGFSKDIFSNVGNQSKIEIIDCFDPLSILNVSNSGQLIREMVVGKLFSLSYTNSMGWSLLHSAILLGDVGLVKQLLQSEDSGNEKTRDQIEVLQTSLELATALHDQEIVQLLRSENTFSIQPSRLVQLCLLTQDGIESFEHPVEVLTSHETASRAIRNRHNSRHCNLIALLRQFCENGDVNFKKEVLEGIFQKVEAFSGSHFRLLFRCWNENSICDVMQILMAETGCPADGKIGSCPYIVFALPSFPLLRLLLQKGAKIDDKDEKGHTALFHAVEKALKSPFQLCSSFNDVIKFLLDNKANPNARNDFSETPLLYCLSYEDGSGLDSFKAVQIIEVWRLLLNAKARALAKNEMDRSLLHLFFSKFLKSRIFQSSECLSLVRQGLPVLRGWGFMVNTRDAEGNTPLHLWASFSHEIFTSNQAIMIEIGNEIISNGGAVNARNDREETPLHLSQSWKQVEILAGKGSPLNAQDLNGDTPFHKFSGKNSMMKDQVKKNLWRICLASGMDPFCPNNQGKSPFDALLEKRFFTSASNLLKEIFESHEALADSARCYRDHNGDSLLHRVVSVVDFKRTQTILIYLLEQGFHVNLQNNAEESPLHVVCKQVAGKSFIPSPGLENSVRLLLKYHADVSLPDCHGNTCVSMLSRNKYLQKLLYEDIERVSIPNKVKWISKSVNHEAALGEVARGTKSVKVDSYHHHETHIGEGSFSLVFPALNEEDGREVAMKRLEKARLEKNGALLEREVKCLLKLSNCPFVVNYISCTSDSHFQYLVVELMEGSLDAYLASSKPTEEQAFTICLNIADGLAFLHAKKVLHRDLKPQNILYTTHPFIVKISDFGLSKVLHAGNGSSQRDTVMHSRAGTRCWMAPELLARKPKEHSKASDIFSCGILFHYVLAKMKHPFGSYSRDSISLQEMEQNIIKKKPLFRGTLTPEAKSLLTKMLFKEPERRPAASSLKKFPFFWDGRKKVEFLTLVGNQREFEEPRSKLSRPLTPVESNLEANFTKATRCIDWGVKFNDITVYLRRKYDSKSAVELVRCIRNAYYHSPELPRNLSDLLWKDFTVLDRFPLLVTLVYEAVEACDSWTKREELRKYFE